MARKLKHLEMSCGASTQSAPWHHVPQLPLWGSVLLSVCQGTVNPETFASILVRVLRKPNIMQPEMFAISRLKDSLQTY